MSGKVLYLWNTREQGYPTTRAEAQAIFIRLLREKEEASSTQLSFFAEPKTQQNVWVTEFTQHLQHIAQEDQTIAIESRQPFMHSVKWLAQYANNNLLILELPNLPEAIFLPMLLKIINLANKLGLVILDDDRFGIYFLPSGDILPKEKESLWLAYIERCQRQRDTTFNNLGEFKSDIEPLIKTLMQDKGFTLKYSENIDGNIQGYTYRYISETLIGYYKVLFGLGVGKYGYLLHCEISINLKLPNFDYSQIPFIEKKSEIINDFNGLLIGYPIFSLAPKEESSIINRKLSRIHTKADANAAMSAVSNILLPLLPLLSGQIQDLVLIMKKYFTMQDWVYENISYLFVLRLANDAEFDNLVNEITILIQNKSDPALEKDFLAFVKFLREEVKPLV